MNISIKLLSFNKYERQCFLFLLKGNSHFVREGELTVLYVFIIMVYCNDIRSSGMCMTLSGYHSLIESLALDPYCVLTAEGVSPAVRVLNADC